MKKLALFVFVATLLLACNTANEKSIPTLDFSKEKEVINSFMDHWHLAATEANYENYFSKLFQEGNQYNLSLPPKDDYMKQIHSTNPNCLKTHQEKYYRGCKKSSKFSGEENDIQFYKTMKKLSKDSIYNFITQYNIKHEQLSEYLLHTQKDKCYMLYKDNKIYFQTINQDNYLITEVTNQPKYDRYVAKTKTGKSLKILLRWKNGNGIAYPAFQIS